MEDHARMAQQGVQPLPVGGDRSQRGEGVGEEKGHRHEEGGEQIQKDTGPGNQRTGPLSGAADSQGGEQGLEKGPQQKGPLLAGPQGGQLEGDRQFAARVLGDVAQLELIAQKPSQEGHQG